MNYRLKDKRFSVSDERLTRKSGENQLIKYATNPPSCDQFGHHGALNFGAGDLMCKKVSLTKRVGCQMAAEQKLKLGGLATV